jgi:hypothetical protein
MDPTLYIHQYCYLDPALYIHQYCYLDPRFSYMASTTYDPLCWDLLRQRSGLCSEKN